MNSLSKKRLRRRSQLVCSLERHIETDVLTRHFTTVRDERLIEKGKQMMIYEALKKDHDTLKPLLDRLVGSADADDSQREQLINQIRDELVPHARAEEAVFYNSLRSIDEVKDLVVHSYNEHMMAETFLRTLQVMEKGNADWTPVAKKLRDAIYHHIDEEENQVFTAAQQVLAEEEAQMMAEAFEQIKPEVRDESFMQQTLDMIANVMPERFASKLRSWQAPSV